MALGTVMVISAIPILPAIIASAASRASSGEGARTIGTKPTSRIFPSAFSFVQDINLSFEVPGVRDHSPGLVSDKPLHTLTLSLHPLVVSAPGTWHLAVHRATRKLEPLSRLSTSDRVAQLKSLGIECF